MYIVFGSVLITNVIVFVFAKYYIIFYTLVKETECDLFQSIYIQCAVTLLQLQIQFSLYTHT